MLVSGDKAVRATAEKHGLEVMTNAEFIALVDADLQSATKESEASANGQ